MLTVLVAGAPTFSRLLLGSAEHAWTLRLLALNGFLQAFLCVPHSLLRIRNQPARFARWTVGGGLGAAAGRLLLVVGFRMGVFGIMLADLLASVVLVAGLSPRGRAAPSDAPRGSGRARCCATACRACRMRCCSR